MEAMLALAVNLQGWRGPVAYGALLIFVCVLLYRFAKMLPDYSTVTDQTPSWSKPYASYEEAMRGKTEEPLDDWMARMRLTPAHIKRPPVKAPAKLADEMKGVQERASSGIFDTINQVIKEFSTGLEKTVSLKKAEGDGLTVLNYGPEVVLKGQPEFLFNWYRTAQGAILSRIAGPGPAGMARFIMPSSEQVVFPYEGLRVAYPVVGEWWRKMECHIHKVEREVSLQVHEHYSWYRSTDRIAELYCGCLAPLNFGVGFGEGPEGPKGIQGLDGGSGRRGPDGMTGLAAPHPPKERCRLCSGDGKALGQGIDGAAMIVPCPRCKGFCWES